jgi:predicted dehydrogenase
MQPNTDEHPPLRLAMLGMVDGNGHPYSWSAIFNGYDRAAMAQCPYAGIPKYLGQQPESAFGIDNVRVTHIWTDHPRDAELVAKASHIQNVVERAEDVIGEVDAVCIATDRGWEHVERARPFVEAGLPIFVDKPMCDNENDLRQFVQWMESGAKIMSSSGLRYCKEFAPFRSSIRDLGELRFASITTCKSWERYGIHALEAFYPIIGPGFISARNTGTLERNVVHLKHKCDADVVVAAHSDMFGALGVLTLCGTEASATAKMSDTFFAFKTQMEEFVRFLRTGERPFPFSETVELMKLVIAGIRSREAGGREVLLSEIEL